MTGASMSAHSHLGPGGRGGSVRGAERVKAATRAVTETEKRMTIRRVFRMGPPLVGWDRQTGPRRGEEWYSDRGVPSSDRTASSAGYRQFAAMKPVRGTLM